MTTCTRGRVAACFRPAFLFIWLATTPAYAQEAGPLPEPLTLEYALSFADASHPALDIAQAAVGSARAGLLAARSRTDTTVTAEGRLRWVQPPDDAINRDNDDHKASLFVRRNLHDFGRSEAAEGSAVAAVSSAEGELRDMRAQRRIEIMSRFFDVVIADKEFSRDDEAMAVAYVTLDRLRQRHEMGQVNDLDLGVAERDYQRVRRVRYAAESRQRLTRAALANALNRPGQLPSSVATPQLPGLKRAVPEVEELTAAALARNPALLSARARVQAAEQRLALARADHRPRLSAELEAAAYARELPTNDRFRGGLTLEVPLYTGGGVKAAVGARQAEFYDAQARLAQVEMQVRQAVLEQYLALQTLQVQREEAEADRAYRELYLDRSRALYEMEVQADIGDAMVRLTEAELELMKAEFLTAVAWAHLEALTGGEITNGTDDMPGEAETRE